MKFKILIIPFILLCSCGYIDNKDAEKDNNQTKPDEKSLKQWNAYCTKDFWGNIDTMHLDTITVFKNSQMGFTELPNKFFKMKNLKVVLLDTQQQLDTLSPSIGDLKELEVFEITKSRIRHLPKEIGNLKKLRKLSIAWGGQLNEIPPEIGNLDLIELDLFRNNLTKLPNEISRLKNLKKLILGENNFSEEEKKRIVTLLPKCKIYFTFKSKYDS